MPSDDETKGDDASSSSSSSSSSEEESASESDEELDEGELAPTADGRFPASPVPEAAEESEDDRQRREAVEAAERKKQEDQRDEERRHIEAAQAAERKKQEDQRVLREKAAAHVRKERASMGGQGGAAERFRERQRASMGDLRRSRSRGSFEEEEAAPSEGAAEEARSLGISPSEVREMRDVFNVIDKDGSGEVDFDEMQALLKLVGMDASEATVKVIMAEVDKDGGGTIDFGEFCSTILRPTMSRYTVSEVQRAFETLSGDASQHRISGEALAAALRNYGPKLTRAAADQVCADFKPDSNGDINYSAVLRMIGPDVAL